MVSGTVLKAISGFYYVERDGDLGIAECSARGRLKKTRPIVGDRVRLTPEGDGKGVIEEILPRRNWFSRPSIANIDQLVIIASADIPVTDPYLVDRVTVVAERKGCDALICVNKCDLQPGEKLYEIYAAAGFRTIRTSAVTGDGIETLRGELAGKVSAFTGNSGAGKSSILNRLWPEFALKTGEVSERLGRGRHTTRHVELFRLPDMAAVADSPGFSSFDTEAAEHIKKEELQYCFRDFAPFLGSCRFSDCAHIGDAGCAVRQALGEGKIQLSRYESYIRLYEKEKLIKDWELTK